MEKQSHSRVLFKTYQQNQLMLIPPSLDELIPPEHPVRTINRIIDKLDLDPLIEQYEGGGASSYHPRMLLKVLVYGYLCNIYSSRKLEAAVRENIHFMWLAAMNRPDHHTINRFRSERLKENIKELFRQVVLLLAEAGMVSLKELYTDGTKLEANANKYSFVWAKSINYNKMRMVKQLEELWRYTQQVARQELSEPEPEFGSLSPEELEAAIDRIQESLKPAEVTDEKSKKKNLQKLKYARDNWPDKVKEYDERKRQLGQRNSLSKTDPDATFMRMKDDHMKNGQLKAGYNLQISTENQCIVHFTLHQNSTDTVTLIEHLESFKAQYDTLPISLTADAGYGSEENYLWLEQEQINAFVKYNYFHKEQKEAAKKPPKLLDPGTLHYDEQADRFICPMGQEMKLISTRKRQTATGYEQTTKTYQAGNCAGCPLAASCKPDKGRARITVNHTLHRLKSKARELLLSEEGVRKRKQRCVDVEPVFGQLKENRQFRRFRLRGQQKVEVEMGLAAMAHNIVKLAG